MKDSIKLNTLIFIKIISLLFLLLSEFNFIEGAEKMKNSRKNKIIFQYSTINALMKTLYDGGMSFDELSKFGNFGIGTFNALDGEMIAFEGNFYKIKADSGKAHQVSGEEKTPFSVVTNFISDTSIVSYNSMNLEELEKFLDDLLPSKNIFYAFKIEGKFDYVKTRSVPNQKEPYPLLVEIVSNQPIFEFKDTEGLMIGFYFPEYMQDINVPGFHFHFITKDKKRGGHLLGLKTSKINIDIEYILGFQMILPDGEKFMEMNLTTDKSELEKVEKSINSHSR